MNQPRTAQFKQVITFLSAKGGTGQTLISSNLACIAAQRHPTLFIQLTKYPDAHTFFDVSTEKNFAHVIDFLEHKEDLFQTFQTLAYRKNNMAILLSPMDPEQTASITETHLSLLINAALQLFTTIVIDLGKEFQEYRAVVKQSDKVVTVSNLDPQSIVRTNQLSEMLEKEFPQIGRHVVINQRPPSIGKKEAQAYFSAPLIHMLSYDNESAWDAIAFATPYALTKSKLAKETGELLDQLLA